MSSPLHGLRVVLVRPSVAGNLGAVARLLANFGVPELRLVRPHADPCDEQARRLATHGESVLTTARSFATLREALADCVLTLATSARTQGLFRQQSLTSLDRIASLAIGSQQHGPVALVFGPEQTGLLNDEITLCHYLITIPTHPDYPVLNLSHAVAICLYELYQHAGLSIQAVPRSAPATHDELERMFEHLRRGLEALHFLWDERADTLMHAVRHMLSRAQLTPVEVEILHGLARQMLWYAGRHQPGDTNARGAEPAPSVGVCHNATVR